MQDVVLIGLGNIGMGYDLSSSGILLDQTMTHLKALSDSEFYSVFGVIDSEKSKSTLAREIYSVRAVCSLDEIQLTKEVDLLTIATPTHTHLDVLGSIPKKLIPKILMIEKPAGKNSEDCLQIAEWADSHSVLVFVNYFRRYLPKVKEARDFVSGLNLGRLLSVAIESYGSLLNIFSHFMDLGLTVTGKHLFCNCPKLTYEGAESILFLECKKCDVCYSFIGLGQSRVTSRMRICFENYQIDIGIDGMEILISKLNSDVSVCFKTSDYIYINYQKLVYTAIATFSNETHFLAGMGQAIEIHRFIESMGLSHGK